MLKFQTSTGLSGEKTGLINVDTTPHGQLLWSILVQVQIDR